MVMKDVMGKTSRPLIPENTVLNEEHIKVLEKFLVNEVDVSKRLSFGAPFLPKEVLQEPPTEKEREVTSNRLAATSFHDKYLDAVQTYKRLFSCWQSGSKIDIYQIRAIIIPLLENVEQVSLDLFTLHHHYSSKQDYFYHHGVSTALITAYLTNKLGYKKGDWTQAGLAGFLSDAGMARLTPSLFEKEGALIEKEYEEIKKHPTYSYRLVEKIPSLTQGAKLAILQHHERSDGSGYPLGINKEKLHPYASIIAIADMYHAMTSTRIYRGKKSPFKVIEEMLQDQFEKFDHQIVKTFVNSMTRFSTGTKVMLSNNIQGEIVFVEEKHPTRPIVRIDKTDEILPLKNETGIFIEEILT